MKVIFSVLIGIAFLAVPRAEAAPPKATGTYAVAGYTLCSARAKTVQANFRLANGGVSTGVQTFNTQENGIVSALTGYLAFRNNGTAKLSFTQIRGPNSTVNAPTSGWSQITRDFPSATYSFTETTLKLGDDTFVMTYGNVVNGVARTIHLIRRETGANPDCVDMLIATKQ